MSDLKGHDRTASARTAPDAPDSPHPHLAPHIGRSWPLLPIYRLSWYITEKNKVGQEAAFSTSEETVKIHPFAPMPKFRLPHPATLSRTHSHQRALGAFVPTLSRTHGNISLTEDKDLYPAPSLHSVSSYLPEGSCHFLSVTTVLKRRYFFNQDLK